MAKIALENVKTTKKSTVKLTSEKNSNSKSTWLTLCDQIRILSKCIKSPAFVDNIMTKSQFPWKEVKYPNTQLLKQHIKPIIQCLHRSASMCKKLAIICVAIYSTIIRIQRKNWFQIGKNAIVRRKRNVDTRDLFRKCVLLLFSQFT